MRFFRAVFKILQPISPSAAAWLAERVFFTPARRKQSEAGRAALKSAHRFTLQVDGRRVVGWRWNGREHDSPLIYLVHGWASRGSRLAAFAAPLLSAGYSVVTYDAPGHGASGWGMSSMPEFARTLAAVVARAGNGQPPAAVIAHSFGCSGTVLAMARGLAVRRLAFLAPAANPPAWLDPFVRALDLKPATVQRLRERSERRLRVRWSELNVCDLSQRLHEHAPLLIVHDKSDETVAWGDGDAIAAAWPGARLVSTQGLGHRGVTHDVDVVRQVVQFVTDRSGTVHTSQAQDLEYDLFFREERSLRVETH